MALLSEHKVTATVPGVTYIQTPAYTDFFAAKAVLAEGWEVVPIEVPAVPVLMENFDGGTLGYWTAPHAVLSTNYKRSGTHSMFLTNPDAPGTGYARLTIDTIPGRTYTLTGWATLASAGNGQIGVTGIGQTSFGGGTLGTFVQRTYVFTATSSTHEIFVFTGGSSGGPGTYWDDISVTQNAYFEEDGLQGWAMGAAGAQIANVAGLQHSGSRSLYTYTSGTSGIVASRSVSTESGRSYTVAAWVMGVENAATVSIGVTGKGSSSNAALTSGIWTQVTYTFTASASSHVIELRTTNAVRELAWDDVTVIRNAYTVPHAAVTASPAVLDVEQVDLTLDDGRAPYVQATLRCALLDPAAMEDIDPRESRRVTVTFTQTFEDWNDTGFRSPESRTFNLGLVARDIDVAEGTMTLTLWSDEAALLRYARVATTAERTYGLSLREAVDLALGKIGAEVKGGEYQQHVADPTMESASAYAFSTAFYRDSSVKQSGTYSVTMSVANAGNYGTLNLRGVGGGTIEVTAGDKYRVRGYYRRGSASVAASINFSIVETNGTNRFDNQPVVMSAGAADGAWIAFDVLYTIPYTGTATLQFKKGAAAGGTGFWSIDNLYVYKVPPADTLPSDELEPVVTNLISNPSVETTSAWGLGSFASVGTTGTVSRQTSGGKYGSAYVRFQANATTTGTPAAGAPGSGLLLDLTTTGYEQGKSYTFSIDARASKAMPLILDIEWRTASAAISRSTSEPILVSANTWNRLTIGNARIPETATVVRVKVLSVNVTGYTTWVSGDRLEVDGLMATEGSTVHDYFDGGYLGTRDPGLWAVAWTGTAHNSTSTLTNLPHNDATIWEPGVTAWDYLTPLLQATDLRLYCDENRVWTLAPRGQVSTDMVVIGAAQNATRAQETISLVDEEDGLPIWFTGVVIAYTENLTAEGERYTRYDTAGTGDIVLTQEYARPYPGPGAAAAILNRAAGRGRVFDLEAMSSYMTTPGMVLAATLPDTPLQTGYVSSVTWSLPSARMKVKSRALTDTPAKAWILATGTWASRADTWATYTP